MLSSVREVAIRSRIRTVAISIGDSETVGGSFRYTKTSVGNRSLGSLLKSTSSAIEARGAIVLPPMIERFSFSSDISYGNNFNLIPISTLFYKFM